MLDIHTIRFWVDDIVVSTDFTFRPQNWRGLNQVRCPNSNFVPSSWEEIENSKILCRAQLAAIDFFEAEASLGKSAV